MPKKNVEPDDDLDLEEDDTEDEETEEEDDSEGDNDSDDEEEETEDSDDDETEEEEKPRRRGRPKGAKSKNTKERSTGIILRQGLPKKVKIVRVMGKNVKVGKYGSSDDSVTVRIPVSDVYIYDDDVYNKMVANGEKITALRDKNFALLKNLQPVISAKKVGKVDPLSDW